MEPSMKADSDLRHYQRLVQLEASESLFFQTRSGTSLISTSGSLLVTGTPGWLGEQVFRTRMPLEPGQMHAVEQDGWVTLTAGPHGQAACLVSLEGRPTLMGALRQTGKALLKSSSGIARIARTRFRSA